MGALLPLVLALAVAQFARETAHGWRAPLPPPLLALAVAAGWLLLLALAGWWLGRRPRLRLWERWDAITAVLGLGAFAALCLGGWARWSPAVALTLLPWAAGEAVSWACHPALAGAGLRRRLRATWHHVRLELLPLLAAMPAFDLCEWLAGVLGTDVWFQGPHGRLLGLAGGLLLVLALLALLPPLLVRLWGARPLPESAALTALREACAAAGVRVAGVLAWPAGIARFYNAAVVGVLPRWRYLLFSEDLLRDLPPDQLRAVLGHELGHVRHGHLLLFLAFAVTSALLVLAALALLIGGSTPDGHATGWSLAGLGDGPGLLFQVPGLRALDPDLLAGGVLAACLAASWGLGFGAVSRACERQADLAGAALAGSHLVMAAALRSVARLAGQREDAPSWRHRSIAQRAAFLERVAVDPSLALHHHRLVARMRIYLIAIAVLLASLALGSLLDPVRRAGATEDPGGALVAAATADPVLGEALRLADSGDGSALAGWMASASPEERATVAMLHLRLADSGPATRSAPGRALPDDRDLWRLRHRFAALRSASCGDAMIDLQLDNALAYALVAGIARPERAQVTQAAALLPALEAAWEHEPDHSIGDTIACVLFRAGRREDAGKRWDRCLELLADGKPAAATPRARAALENLYRRRRAAAADPGAELPLAWELPEPPP